MEQKAPWWRNLWHKIESIHTAIWLWEIALAALAAWSSRHFMHTIGSADYWLPIAVFIGTLAFLATCVQTGTWSFSKIRLWRHRPSLHIKPHSGKQASIEVTHSGIPTIWEAKRRILRVTNNSQDIANPDPLLRRCLFERDGRPHASLKLAENESASLCLAQVKWSHPLSSQRETWVSIPNPDEQHDTRVEGDVIIEVIFNTRPPRQRYAKTFRVKVARVANSYMECKEIT